MEERQVQLISGKQQLRGEVVVETPTTYTVQTPFGLFTVNRDGTARRGGSFRLYNPTPEEVAEARRVEEEQLQARQARARASAAAAVLRDLAAAFGAPAVMVTAEQEQRVNEAINMLREVLRG